MDKDVLAFVCHKSNCDYLQPMWHQGPCDCGLYALFDNLRSVGLSTDARSVISLSTLYTLLETCPDLMADWILSRHKTIPLKLYMCKQCRYAIAEKQTDIQGWNGYCHNCGMIAQDQVGEMVFCMPSVAAQDSKK